MTSEENRSQMKENNQVPHEENNLKQEQESTVDTDTEEAPTNRGFRIGCMTFCLAVTVLFIWVWHHQSQFNDNYREALFHLRNDEPTKAIEAYQKAIKNKNRTLFFKSAPTAYNNLGQAYMYAEQYPQAIATFRSVIQMAPDQPEGYVNLATVFLSMNDPKSAYAICIDALQDFPMYALLHYNLACAYALTDDPQNALDSLKQAVDLDPDLREYAQNEDALLHIVPKLP